MGIAINMRDNFITISLPSHTIFHNPSMVIDLLSINLLYLIMFLFFSRWKLEFKEVVFSYSVKTFHRTIFSRSSISMISF